MFNLDDIINISPYSLAKVEKEKLYAAALHDLTCHHYEHCLPYRKILDLLKFDPYHKHAIEEIPFLPVRLFKDYELLSVDKSEVIKTMVSSGTTGQKVSKIFLDRTTAAYQTKVLAKITSHFIGPKRLPMLIIDTRAVIKDRNLFSARGAGILGFSMLGYDVTYALDENMGLDIEAINIFCEKHRNEDILIFGFTYMIWEFFYKKLIILNKKLFFERGILLHGGGWKKLIEQAVNNQTFKQALQKVCGIKKIYNYYGMVEQTGSIFVECEKGHLHASIFSDVIIRDKKFSVCSLNQTGLVQLVSLLPFSYPCHSILSEDLGEILGEDNCACGRQGKYFKIHGRIKNAEIRGCSDSYAAG